MAGIVFFSTKDVKKVTDFYLKKGIAEMWLEQADCKIIRQKGSNFLLGFCEREKFENEGCLTFFYPTKEEVDYYYELFKEEAISEPKVNEKYEIYNFFAKDPEGRTIEFQAFLSNIGPYQSAEENLMLRRSHREFEEKKITQNILDGIFEICRYAPSASNTQGYYFLVVKDKEKKEKLSKLRGGSSAPIGRAPLAVAIVVDTSKTKRWDQDGSIAAYHFMLSAWDYNLGTCWIAAMNEFDEAKEILEIPKEHYIATISPLGYPKKIKTLPERRKKEEFVFTI